MPACAAHRHLRTQYSNVVQTERGSALLMEAPDAPDPCHSHRRCTFCGCCVSVEEHGPFRDALSFKEFQMSGLCQQCQDDIFF